MSESKYIHRNKEKTEKNKQFSESGIFVKEDDQDWGSSGMYDIQAQADKE